MRNSSLQTKRIYLIGLIVLLLETIVLSITLPNHITLKASKGDSMCPTLGVLSINLQKEVSPEEDIIPGEVYTYMSSGEEKFVQHRFVGKLDRETYMFKADNDHRTYITEITKRDQIKRKLLYNIDIITCEMIL